MSVFSQVTAGELHKYIFKTRLPRAQVFELISVLATASKSAGIVRCGSRTLRQRVESSRRTTRRSAATASVEMIGVSVAVSADLELNHMMTAKSVDQIGRSAFGDNLAVVDYGSPSQSRSASSM